MLEVVILTTAIAREPSSGGTAECWCCGQARGESEVVRLGGHLEVAVCLRCAHFLHQQARSREDAAGRRSPATLVCGGLRAGRRAGRRLVIRRGWHEAPAVGPALRWLGSRLP